MTDVARRVTELENNNDDDFEHILEEQAARLFEICDSNDKGFIVRADLPKLDGLIPNVEFSQLEEFFEEFDKDRVNLVNKENFVIGIKPLLLKSDRSKQQENLKKKYLRDIAKNNFNTISLGSDEPKTKPPKLVDTKPKFEIIEELPNSESLPDTKSTVIQKSNKTKTKPAPIVYSVNNSLHIPPDPMIEVVTRSISNPEALPFRVQNENDLRDDVSPLKSPYCPEADRKEIEKRNHTEFAEVLKRASRSTNDLPRAVYDISSVEVQNCLADEIRETKRRYFGTPNLVSFCLSKKEDLRTPERIFKVVFVGDSAVGKTCFLHRFCHNRFKPLFNATIGVDFTVKTLRLGDRLIAVQLWDTAGQERFRSITKQYFRKADGVVLMYDITSEQSFLNVRNWIESVRVGVDDGCVMCLVGNKVDLCPSTSCRTVTYEDGKKLADEFDMIFFETSAYTGLGINDCMRAVAIRLQQREDEQLEEALKLEMTVQTWRKSWCCV